MNLEIRWFIEGKKPAIQKWMDDLKFKKQKDRVDIYLVLPKPHCDFVGIKTREGKFEIKYRIATYNYRMKDKAIQGKAEFWSKYSKEIDNTSLEAFNTINLRKVAVSKKRFQVGYILKPPDYEMEYSKAKHIDQGLKIEITDLEIIENEEIKIDWWTIGIDFFGVNHEEILEAGLPVVFENYPLEIKNTLTKSFSYPEWVSFVGF